MMYKHLTFDDRKQIENLYGAGINVKDIAKIMNIHFTTIYREINKGLTSELDEKGRFKYNSEFAQRKYCERAHQRGKRKE